MNGAAPILLGVIGGAFAGAIAGSFLATLALRWPAGRSIARGRSACDSCAAPIPAWRLVPLASWLAQRGRCAACGARIDPRHPLMEAACAGIGALALALDPGWGGAAGALFGWLLAALALLDAEHFWLPDKLVLPLLAIGLAAGLAGVPPPLADRLLGALVGFALLAIVAWGYARTRGRVGMGQGDPKLLAAIGAWLGWRPLPWVVLGACLLGLAWVALTAARGRTVARTDRLPLGTLLAIAGFAAWCVVVGGG